MTPKERAIAALTGEIPDEVPTFELAVLITREVFGRTFFQGEKNDSKPWKERERMVRHNAQLYVDIAERYEHSIIMVTHMPSSIFPQRDEELFHILRCIREMAGDKYLLITHGDGTFAIPPGDDMETFCYEIVDHPEEFESKAEKMADEAIERAKRYIDGGIDGFALCADYAFNSGPFLSPSMFSRFITPYLFRIIRMMREWGAYVIKHTDGNIMPIIDQLISCQPHALHSLDPMAGVDIKEVKEKYGKKVCLCGNVNCALLQTGTKEEIQQSAEYALKYGKPGGGYIFSTSNCIFEGMPPENYEFILEIWRKRRSYNTGG